MFDTPHQNYFRDARKKSQMPYIIFFNTHFISKIFQCMHMKLFTMYNNIYNIFHKNHGISFPCIHNILCMTF